MLSLLRNPSIRDKMAFTEEDLSSAQKKAGHFLCGKIAKKVREILPKEPDRPVLPLYLGWWSDSTNVSCGGIVFLRSLNSSVLTPTYAASLNGTAHPLLQWFYNVPMELWSSSIGSSPLCFLPDFTSSQLPPHIEAHVGDIKAAVFHRCIELLSRSLDRHGQHYRNGI